MTVTTNALLVADRARNGLTQRDADVLDRVMRIDVQVAVRLDVEIDEAMPRDLVEHVIEEGHTTRELRVAAAVEVDADRDLRLGGIATDARAAREDSGFESGVHDAGFIAEI